MPSNHLTNEDMTALHKLGWEFLPYGPEDWMWTKLNAQGERVAVQCDATWDRDLREIGIGA